MLQLTMRLPPCLPTLKHKLQLLRTTMLLYQAKMKQEISCSPHQDQEEAHSLRLPATIEVFLEDFSVT